MEGEKETLNNSPDVDSEQNVQPRPYNILYTFAVILTALFILGFLWFALWSATSTIRGAIGSSMNQHDIANTTYQTYELADTFLNNLWTYMLVIIVFGLLAWVFIYSQRKGIPTYGGYE